MQIELLQHPIFNNEHGIQAEKKQRDGRGNLDSTPSMPNRSNISTNSRRICPLNSTWNILYNKSYI